MRLYVDTNVLYLFLRPPRDMPALRGWLFQQQSAFAASRNVAVVSPLVMDELAYRLLLAALKDAGDPNPLATLRADKHRVVEQHGPRVTDHIKAILELPGLTVCPVTKEVLDAALEYMVTYQLLPRDACHLAIALSDECDGILSTDPDFQRSEELIPCLGPESSRPSSP